MAEEVKTAAVGNQAGGNAENSGYVYQNRRYVGTKETVAYVVYDMSQSFNINAYSQRFVTNILQVSLKLQRIANVINGIWDVINDVLFGAIVDKTRTRWGKFRPWLLIGTITNAVILYLMFAAPPALDGSGLVAYAAVTYVLWGVTYTMMDIPFWSMIPAFTEGGKEREGLSTLARSCAGVGSALITIITVKCVVLLGQGNERAGFKWFALIIAVLFVIFITITCMSIKEKSTVNVEYAIGMERMVRAAIANFEKMGLKPTIYRNAFSSFRNRGNSKRGCYATSVNRQFDYDHKADKAVYLDKAFVERRLETLRTVYEDKKELAAGYAGPAVIEVFGETLFEPENKKTACHYSDKQNELNVYYASQAGQITNQYIKGEERSFTIIAYPLPQIGSNFEEIFDKTVELNTLDYTLYRDMQAKIIEVLDQGVRAHIRGKGDNETDMTVELYRLKNPQKETIFENCVADVNIPVGEVFTSPVLTGTHGVLHVSYVYLNGLRYENLKMTFEDGKVVDYSCSNFDSEEENHKYIYDNVLMHHDTLPLGEFAIGTNTTAYRMAKDFDIADKLPILIAEKTGPHFAVGDTCYSQAEDTPVYNPDGKEIVARDNEISILRKEDESKAYFNCHTDITIPYDELDCIYIERADGSTGDIIRDGRFVVPGTEKLNEPLENKTSFPA